MVSALIAGIVRFSALPGVARLIFISLPCATVAESIGGLRRVIRLNPEIFFGIYALVEGAVFIAGALILLRLPLARRLAWIGITALVAVVLYQYLVLEKTGLSIPAFLTQGVVIVALYLLVLAEAALTQDSAALPIGVLLLCIAVLVYYSLAPLSFPATSYFYYKGKIALSAYTANINTISCILRYGLTLAAFLLMRRPEVRRTVIPYER